MKKRSHSTLRALKRRMMANAGPINEKGPDIGRNDVEAHFTLYGPNLRSEPEIRKVFCAALDPFSPGEHRTDVPGRDPDAIRIEHCEQDGIAWERTFTRAGVRPNGYFWQAEDGVFEDPTAPFETALTVWIRPALAAQPPNHRR